MNLLRVLILGLVLSAGTTAFANRGGFQGATLNNNEYIIGGTTVAADDPVASSTVLIKIVTRSKINNAVTSESTCSGSIIAQDMVVTAAHCMSSQPENIHVLFVRDENTLSTSATISSDQVLPITGYITNPDFNSAPLLVPGLNGEMPSDADWHDIAIIRLDGALPAGYKPAAILPAAASAAIKTGDDVLLAGYGISDAKTEDGAGTLRETQVKVGTMVGQTEVAVDQRHGHGACHGDSGGPGFVRANGQLMLWGVEDREYPANSPDDCASYIVYTRFSSYTDWITQAETTLRNDADLYAEIEAETD